MSELKPLAYLHYYFGGYAPDGYTEESELVELHDYHKFEGMENSPAEGIVPLYAIPEGMQLAHVEPTVEMIDSVKHILSYEKEGKCEICSNRSESERLDKWCHPCGNTGGNGVYETRQLINESQLVDVYKSMLKAANQKEGES